MSVMTMAKKKAKPAKMVLGMRGSEEWKQWLDEFAEHCGLRVVELIGRSLEDYAEKRGFRRPPRR